MINSKITLRRSDGLDDSTCISARIYRTIISYLICDTNNFLHAFSCNYNNTRMVILQAQAALDILTRGANGNVWIVLLTFTCLRPRATTFFAPSFRTRMNSLYEMYFTLFIYYLNSDCLKKYITADF